MDAAGAAYGYSQQDILRMKASGDLAQGLKWGQPLRGAWQQIGEGTYSSADNWGISRPMAAEIHVCIWTGA